MAVQVFADPFGTMQQGRNVESQIQERETRTALELMSMQQALDQRAKEQEYIRRTQTPPPPPGPNGQPSDPTRNMNASDMMYAKIGDIDKKIATASQLGLQTKVDALYKERDAMLSRYSIAQKREEDARKRVQDQRKETIAEVGKFAGAADAILSSDSKPEDKLQQLQALEASAQEENPDAWRMISRGKPMNWGDPQTQNAVKALSQQAMDPTKRQELAIKKLDEDRKERDLKQKEAQLAEVKRYHDARIAISRENGPGATGQSGNPAKDEAMAWDYLIRGHSPPARGGAYDRAMAKVAEIAKSNGMTTEDLITASADVKTKLAAKRQFETRTQNLSRAENQLMLEVPVMEDAMKKLDLPSIPVAARGQVKVLRALGNPDVTKLDQAAEAVFNEFEGIITGNPGTLNVQDVQNARHAYEQAQTPQQMRAAIEGMRRIITNAKKANDLTRKEIMEGISGSVNPSAHKETAPKSDKESKAIPLDQYLQSKGF